MSLALTLLRLPLYVVQIFTGAKSFRRNPIIGSPVLNRLGLHALRVILARLTFAIRRALLAPWVAAPQRRQFNRDGIVIIEGFITVDDLAKIHAEIKAAQPEVRRLIEGDTALYRTQMDAAARAQLPTLARVLSSKPYRRLLRYTSASLAEAPLVLERMVFADTTSTQAEDPQKTAHTDTFHPTMKSWLYLKDVTASDGPFYFSRGSQRLTGKRLRWEYHRSITASARSDGHSEDGSFRVTDQDLDAMGAPAPEPVLAKAGTLVIANTNGVHHRGDGMAGNSRLEVFAAQRASAFLPIPAPSFSLNAFAAYTARRFINRRRDARFGNSADHPFPQVQADKLTAE